VSGPIQPLRCRPACYAAFGEAVARLGEPGGLVRAAATIALHEHPSADLALIEQRIEALAEQVRTQALGRSPKARLALLHRVLFEEHDFRGGWPGSR
jgi:hypothetical protein